MDYEKAYNEAIKRAKAIIEVAEKEEEVYKSAITIFPELYESEDERIRKEIEQLIQCMHDADPRKKRWIAWLEKQSERKPTWNEKDEQIANNIRMLIEKYAFSQSAVDVNGDLCEKIYIDMDNWLKSIKEKIR